MAILRGAKRAFGVPGIAPRWTQSAKDAIGTAYSAGSTVWFTVSAGILNELYYPTIDRPRREGVRHMSPPGSDALVIFGGSGDLAYKKIFPASRP